MGDVSEVKVSRLGRVIKPHWFCYVNAFNRGDGRAAADALLAAIQATTDTPWAYGRYVCLQLLGDMFFEQKADPARADRQAYKKILQSDEPALYRAHAAISLAFFFSCRKFDLQGAVDYLQEAQAIIHAMDPSDKNRRVFAHRTVADELERLSRLVKVNLLALQDPQAAMEDEVYIKSRMAWEKRGKEIGITCLGLSHIATFPRSIPESVRKRVDDVGGGRCDACGKALEELGVQRLSCCTLCKMAFYCSKECQRKQWRAGHKQACRKPNEIKTNDYLIIRNIKSDDSLNGLMVKAMEPDPHNEDQWRVEIPEDRIICVSIKNLYHIRPEM
jgi:hypothetical protein